MMPAVSLVISAALAALAASALDNQNTIALTPVADVAIFAIVAIVCLVTALGYVRDSGTPAGTRSLSDMRRDKPSAWLIAGLAIMVFFAAVTGLAAWYVLSVLTPRLPTVREHEFGTIENLQANYSRTRICNLSGVLFLQSGRRAGFCYEWGVIRQSKISPTSLTSGDRVVVTFVHSALGTAIESIARTRIDQDAPSQP
jgi:hypothetical protein